MVEPPPRLLSPGQTCGWRIGGLHAAVRSVACMGSPPLQALHTAGRHDGSGLAGMSRRSDDSPSSSADQAPVLTAVNRLCAGVMGARCRHTLMQQSTLRPRACLRRHKHSKHSVQQGG